MTVDLTEALEDLAYMGFDAEAELAEILKQELGELAKVQPLDGELFKSLMGIDPQTFEPTLNGIPLRVCEEHDS